MAASAAIPATLRRRVRLRAGDRCEYCRLPQANQEATFHVDHIVPRAANGDTAWDNLALACVGCSLRKGAREGALDPVSGEVTRLYHPRSDPWQEHFTAASDGALSGNTPSGRATAVALNMNRPLAVLIRFEEIRFGRWP